MPTQFSIICTIYNTREDLLRTALNSLLKLEYLNYEVILVNDGSNEDTSKIINEYKNSFYIINQVNKGISASRLVGLKQAKGEYIVFFDSDDIINPKALNILNEIIEKHKIDLIIHNSPRFKIDLSHVEINKPNYLEEGIQNKENVLKQLCMLHINGIGNKVARKELYEDMAQHIDTSFINGEDLQQSTYIILKSNSIYYTTADIDYYRLPEERRKYYDYKNINDINFLVPTYNMLFSKGKRKEYLPFFNLSAKNSVIFNSFRISLYSKNFKETESLLNSINDLEITKILSTIGKTSSIITNILFDLLTKKQYHLLALAAKIYDIVFKIADF